MSQTLSPLQETNAPDPPVVAKSPKRRLGKLKLLLPLALLAIGAGTGIGYYYLSQPEDTAIALSGRIEGYETKIGTKVGGRIELVTVREGDRVSQGQVIAHLDDDELQAQLKGANARLAAARAKAAQASLQIDAIQTQIDAAQLNVTQSQGDASGKIEQAQANVAAAQAQLAGAIAQVQQAQAEVDLARSERDRYRPLLQEGVIPQQQFDQVQTRLDSAQATLTARQAAVSAARKQVNAAQGGLAQAQTSSLNPEIRSAQVEGLQVQLAQARSQLIAARAEVENAQAAQTEIQAKLSNLEIISPIDGVILTRTVEPGEVIASGKTIATIVNLDDVYLRGYVPEGEIGDVRVGQAAQVYLDSNPDQPLTATVTQIDTQASFTPENIYFKDDRVTQVFGLKLSITNPEGFAKPGMPADGKIIEETAAASY
jgi:HlyD family secretion protein